MAEQEPTPEQLEALAAANKESESSVNYKPPAQKSLQEIQQLDEEDESLRKYKEALLGKVATVAGQWASSTAWDRNVTRRLGNKPWTRVSPTSKLMFSQQKSVQVPLPIEPVFVLLWPYVIYFIYTAARNFCLYVSHVYNSHLLSGVLP